MTIRRGISIGKKTAVENLLTLESLLICNHFSKLVPGMHLEHFLLKEINIGMTIELLLHVRVEVCATYHLVL